MFIKESRTIITKTIGEAWIDCLRMIVNDGIDYHDEGRLIKELIGISIIINNPSHRDLIIGQLGNPENIKTFEKGFFSEDLWLKDVDHIKNFGDKDAISYSVRMFNYLGFNQIDNVINRLAKIPESKRCLVSLPMPDQDWKRDYLPCIDTVHFLLRDKKLNLFIHCRGLDFAQKAYANLLCLGKLQQNVLDGINKISEQKYTKGKMQLMVDSCHIYKDTLDVATTMIANYED